MTSLLYFNTFWGLLALVISDTKILRFVNSTSVIWPNNYQIYYEKTMIAKKGSKEENAQRFI